MCIGEIETFMQESRRGFRTLIAKYVEGMKEEMKSFVKSKIDECSSEFEVEVLQEQLQEEYKMYLDQLNGE